MNEKQLSIKEMAEETGVSIHMLRYYERIGLMPAVARAPSGHRRYTEGQIHWVIFLRRLRATGMPINKIQRYVALVRMGNSTIQERLKVMEDHQRAIEQNLSELQQNLELIKTKIASYKATMQDKLKNAK